eukprot:364053-Chlamydomonas_euryale.AAC.12
MHNTLRARAIARATPLQHTQLSESARHQQRPHPSTHAQHLESARHGQRRARAVRRGLGDVVRVARHAVAPDFCNHGRPPRARMPQLFQHERARAVAHHKAVAARVKRAARERRGRVERGGQRLRGVGAQVCGSVGTSNGRLASAASALNAVDNACGCGIPGVWKCERVKWRWLASAGVVDLSG